MQVETVEELDLEEIVRKEVARILERKLAK